MPCKWLKENADYCEEVEVGHRAKDDKLKALNKSIRLQLDQVQKLPSCLVKAGKPSDLILTSRQKVHGLKV